MKVFLTSCETGAGVGVTDSCHFRRSPKAQTSQRTKWCHVPKMLRSSSSLDLREEDYFASLRANPLLRRFPEKRFVCDRSDLPIGL